VFVEGTSVGLDVHARSATLTSGRIIAPKLLVVADTAAARGTIRGTAISSLGTPLATLDP
jgi:hypothetical protein